MRIVDSLLVVLFWLSAAAVLYAYLGYPLVIMCFSRWFGRTPRPPVPNDSDLPTVTLLIVAHNEEAVIEERIQNALALDYPAKRLEIIVASDGSTDATVPIVRSYGARGVRLLNYSRRGKSAVLNAAFGVIQGKVVILSDANTMTEPTAARHLARWFFDPKVGVVCGRLILTDPSTGGNVDSVYWKYETFLKQCESRLGALLGSNGAIYAIRRKVYVPLPAGTMVDDFVVPLLARLQSGCAIHYDTDVVAHEETAPDIKAEFQRRCRIGAGGFQSLGLLRNLLHPRHGWIAFTFFSHKVLRWHCPFFLLFLLASSLLLVGQPLYGAALAAQLGFYLITCPAALLAVGARLPKPLRLAAMFTGMNLAFLVGFWRWLRGGQRGLWRPTPRLTILSRKVG